MLKFGQGFANEIRRRLPRADDKWRLDEVVIHWLWPRAGDQHGIVLGVMQKPLSGGRFASS